MSITTPLVVTVAPTGAEVSREENPAVPYSAAEVAAESIGAVRAGATVVHLHARTPDGSPTGDPGVFREITDRIRAEVDCVVMFSTGGAAWMGDEERLACLEAGPDLASLTPGSVNFGTDLLLNPLPSVERYAERIYAAGARPEIEIFDTGMIPTALRLLERGVLLEPAAFNLVLGVPGGMPGTVEALVHARSLLPPGSPICVTGIGRAQPIVTMTAVAAGLGVRVGFEDNILLRRGVPAPSNAALVERVVGWADSIGRPVADVAQTRAVLGVG
ncbi:MAG: 3-keto-5-aminohexanoate cleavage protein [Gaiellales bacterium]